MEPIDLLAKEFEVIQRTPQELPKVVKPNNGMAVLGSILICVIICTSVYYYAKKQNEKKEESA